MNGNSKPMERNVEMSDEDIPAVAVHCQTQRLRDAKATPAALILGDSANRYTDANFAQWTARQIASELSHFEGGDLSIQGYTPPGFGGHGQGMFVARLQAETKESPVGFSVIFGVRRRGGGHIREWVADGPWTEVGDSRVAYVSNWDEAFLLICALGQRLNLRCVRLGYGA